MRRAFSTVPKRSSQSVASFIRWALPQAMPPLDLMKSSTAPDAECTRRSTPGLGLARLVEQEVFDVFRGMNFEIFSGILHLSKRKAAGLLQRLYRIQWHLLAAAAPCFAQIIYMQRTPLLH